MSDDFFKLHGQFDQIDEGDFFEKCQERKSELKNAVYLPAELNTIHLPNRTRIREISFTNISLSKTAIAMIEFEDCIFNDCLFMGTIFSECRFTNCKFINCNTHRIEFKNTYIDPASFVEAIPDKSYANIGVYLFQELLRNSRSQSQPDFSDTAQYYFRKWQRYHLQDDLKTAGLSISGRGLIFAKIVTKWIYEKITGSGVRLRNFALFTVSFILLASTFNWLLVDLLGLEADGKRIESPSEAIYFTVITLTTLGYGDITPATSCGRLVIAFEALLGFCLLAVLTSMIYRRISA